MTMDTMIIIQIIAMKVTTPNLVPTNPTIHLNKRALSLPKSHKSILRPPKSHQSLLRLMNVTNVLQKQSKELKQELLEKLIESVLRIKNRFNYQ